MGRGGFGGGGSRGFSGGGGRGFSGRSSFGGSRGSSSVGGFGSGSSRTNSHSSFSFGGGSKRSGGSSRGFSGGSERDFSGRSSFGSGRQNKGSGFDGVEPGGPGPAVHSHHHHDTHYIPIPVPPPVYGPPPAYGPPPGYGSPPTYGPPSVRPVRRSKSSVFIVLSVIAVIAFIFVLSGIFSLLNGGGSGNTNITVSTAVREALPAGAVNETGYFTDELGWIQNETKLESGLKHFYRETGVQPYIYITGDVGTEDIPEMSDIEAFGNAKYDALFTDEAHLLLVFYENYGGYATGCITGTQAKTVIDSEASDILLDYLDRNYYSDMTEDEFFSESFRDAADDIMAKPASPAPVLIVLGVLGLLIAFFIWRRHAKKQKAIKEQRDREILETPLEKFGDAEAEALANKYDDDPNT